VTIYIAGTTEDVNEYTTDEEAKNGTRRKGNKNECKK
jgi:hypothetical protein